MVESVVTEVTVAVTAVAVIAIADDDASIYELPELTGQSLILLCQVRCQLACLNIFSFRWIQMDSNGFRWIQMD